MHDNRRTRLVLGVLLIIAIALITLDFKDGGASPARGLGADIFGPGRHILVFFVEVPTGSLCRCLADLKVGHYRMT